ncbi:hypothetical protein [Flavobacterium degerlachei]|jgi:hypothetical protein|uniref:Uncharacterized protein n=1 Tax=Flavobacterium degerlachei TaxID=229203 RepID=A0A1H2QRI9_9FLAO|nr:hypothetical protein [Flavobacterium degerlachei]SDW09490.1 hypothetical protein SAMN05444338_101244 [Flavobacterium degerlachei]
MKKIVLTLIIVFSIFSCKEKIENSPSVNLDNKVESISDKPDLETTVKNQKPDSLKVDNRSTVIDHYICYKDDKVASRMIWISFTDKEDAVQIKYKGQKAPIDLVFIKEEFIKGGAHPTIIKYYSEKIGMEINGEYKLTHSGNWDYVEYTRGKDDRKFNFTIDFESNPYGKEACF